MKILFFLFFLFWKSYFSFINKRHNKQAGDKRRKPSLPLKPAIQLSRLEPNSEEIILAIPYGTGHRLPIFLRYFTLQSLHPINLLAPCIRQQVNLNLLAPCIRQQVNLNLLPEFLPSHQNHPNSERPVGRKSSRMPTQRDFLATSPS